MQIADAIIITIMTIIFFESIRRFIARRKLKPIVVNFTVTRDMLIAACYEETKRLIEVEGYRSDALRSLAENLLDNEGYMYAGIMKYINETCPIEKFNQASAQLPTSDPMQQRVEL